MIGICMYIFSAVAQKLLWLIFLKHSSFYQRVREMEMLSCSAMFTNIYVAGTADLRQRSLWLLIFLVFLHVKLFTCMLTQRSQ